MLELSSLLGANTQHEQTSPNPNPYFLSSATVAFADDARAQEILKQARQAIGGDEQLQKIQGLQINGQYRRVFGERQMGGEREISILFPTNTSSKMR